MDRHNKTIILIYAFLAAVVIVACGKAREDEFTPSQQDGALQMGEGAEPVINGDETVNAKESSVDQQENSTQAVENADSEATAEEILDLFINGVINAAGATDLAPTFYITDLNMDSEEWDSYSIGDKVDLDNDGEDELIINGVYGGIYLDAHDNRVYEFARGGGTALKLSYTYYNGDIWIMYSNRMNAGYEFYHMEKFEGADNLVAEMNFGEELIDRHNPESGIKCTWNGAEISYDEYTAFCGKIFAAEVSTSCMNDNIQVITTGQAPPCIQQAIDKTRYLVEVHFSSASTQSRKG